MVDKTDRRLNLRAIREELELSQVEFATLLAVSPRAIQSSEQRWRKASASVEKMALLLLLAKRHGTTLGSHICWEQTDCPKALRDGCVTYRSRQGHLCWLMTGTMCRGVRSKTWAEKLMTCEKCDFFDVLLMGKLPLQQEDKTS